MKCFRKLIELRLFQHYWKGSFFAVRLSVLGRVSRRHLGRMFRRVFWKSIELPPIQHCPKFEQRTGAAAEAGGAGVSGFKCAARTRRRTAYWTSSTAAAALGSWISHRHQRRDITKRGLTAAAPPTPLPSGPTAQCSLALWSRCP